MNVKDAVQHDVRQWINDLDEENWSDKQIIEAMHFAIRRMRNKMQYVNREHDTHILALDMDDFVEVHGLYGWQVPYYVQRVQNLFVNDLLTDPIPYKKSRQFFDSGNHWLMIPGYKRRVGLRYSLNELYLQYIPRMPTFHWGTIESVVGNDVELNPAVADAAGNPFRMSRYDDAYKGWGFEVINENGAAAGDIHQPEASEFNHGAAPTTTVTLDATAVVNVTGEDSYAMLMPWDGLMDEALCLFCAYRLLVAEGHRRQAAEIQPLLAAAEDELTNAGMLDGPGNGMVVEDVN